MIALIDYDAGNTRSVGESPEFSGEESLLTRDREALLQADKVILPGVGNFGEAMETLNRYGLISVIHEIVEKKTPFLGICLGLQLLFEESQEAPGIPGLGILKGKILKIPAGEGLKIPHMGWNSLELKNQGRLFAGIPEGAYVYFVHSYYLRAQEREIVKASARLWGGDRRFGGKGQCVCLPVPPGESSGIGLAILKNFVDLGKGE